MPIALRKASEVLHTGFGGQGVPHTSALGMPREGSPVHEANAVKKTP